jgi:MoaA/NifB/PqqE/SkfB family radical SAM enzyme
LAATPRFFFVELTRRCPLQCLHCYYWRRGDSPLRMPQERLEDLLEEYAELAPGAAVVICGGEAMTDPQYLPTCRKARSLGLRVLSVTSGVTITTPAIAEQVLREGPHEITVSLDAPRADLHDAHRGRREAFLRACRALKVLSEVRDQIGQGRVYCMGLVTAETAPMLEEWHELVFSLGATKLKLNLLQPTFGFGMLDENWTMLNLEDQAKEFERLLASESSGDQHFAQYAVTDYPALEAVLRRCDERWGIRRNPEFLRSVRLYCEGAAQHRAFGDLHRGWLIQDFTTEPICNSGERNIMVTQDGIARLCFMLPAGRLLERRGDLRRFWEEESRLTLTGCCRPCGISHSVREKSATLP